ncbi:hypothetical protein E3E14_16685 [Streptomyces sp. ICN441]|uniref:hypothetical protein n=1 Tax=Streptomyces sp. ICN441 TaxID=2558286 RepID=UPI00106D20F4|nr:hypothetical protein [Streptomyces sp. ICN441]TFE49002.1 hypothetical protein E3E14_16685 [Streptomyces sp. ICN441]
MPDTPTRGRPYPGRPELDSANMRFRRALSRLHKEAVRHDPELLPRLAAIVGEATEHLARLAGDAEAAENTSERHRKALALEQEKARRAARVLARRGSPRGAQILSVLDRQLNGSRGDGT